MKYCFAVTNMSSVPRHRVCHCNVGVKFYFNDKSLFITNETILSESVKLNRQVLKLLGIRLSQSYHIRHTYKIYDIHK